MEMERNGNEVMKKPSKFKRICVFCGSSQGKKSSYQDAAVELGNELVCTHPQLLHFYKPFLLVSNLFLLENFLIFVSLGLVGIAKKFVSFGSCKSFVYVGYTYTSAVFHLGSLKIKPLNISLWTWFSFFIINCVLLQLHVCLENLVEGNKLHKFAS